MNTSMKFKLAAIVVAGSALTTAAVLYVLKDAQFTRADA